MDLTIGPNAFFWTAEAVRAFYRAVAASPVSRVVVGEWVCSKRLPFWQDEIPGAVEALQRAGIGHLLVRNDLDRGRTGGPAPDTVERVGRQPLRKLSRNERFVSPASSAAERGLPTTALVAAMGAALEFDVPSDEQSVEMQRRLREEDAHLGNTSSWDEQLSFDSRLTGGMRPKVTAAFDVHIRVAKTDQTVLDLRIVIETRLLACCIVFRQGMTRRSIRNVRRAGSSGSTARRCRKP